MEDKALEFHSLDEVYSYLELHIHTSSRDYDLSLAIKRLGDSTTDKAIVDKLKWECYVFDFILNDGQAKPLHSSTKEDGTTVFAYPSYDDLGIKGLEYLGQRAQEAKNDYLISRYNQILWNAPKPHRHSKYAKDAVDSYLNILGTLNCISEERKQRRDCIEIIKNGFGIAFQIKYKIESFKMVLNEWLFGQRKFKSALKILLLEFMLDSPQFKKDDFKNCLKLVERIGILYKKNDPDSFFTKRIYETGLLIAQKTGNDTKVWNKRIGDTLIQFANSRMDDETKIVPLSLLKDAIPYYKQAGLDKKVKEAELRYFELKKGLKLTKIESVFTDEENEEWTQYLDAKSKRVLELTSDKIWGYLLIGDDIFPKKTKLTESVKNRKSSFMDYAVTLKFDINNNVSKQNDSKEVKEKSKIYESYGHYMRLYVNPFLHRIFIDGIKLGKLTHKSLIQFINEHTWLGQEFTKFDSGGDLIRYRWVSVLAPSIYEYFFQTESALKSSNPYTNYIMPIDSLTLKFEGALRDFASMVKLSTTVSGKGNVLREKYVEELLTDPELHKYFDEDDRLFFSYLFIDKEGMNLRNNIAHCFYRFNDYNFQIMHLLICAFLRLGKYKVNVTRSQPNGRATS